MERARAALAGLAVFVVLYGGIVLVRTLTRFFYATVWFVETVALLAFSALLAYLAYRVFWGASDDPRKH